MQLILMASDTSELPDSAQKNYQKYDVIDILEDDVFAGADIVPPKFYVINTPCNKSDVEHLKIAEFSEVHLDNREIRRRRYSLASLSAATRQALDSTGVVNVDLSTLLSSQSEKTGV